MSNVMLCNLFFTITFKLYLPFYSIRTVHIFSKTNTFYIYIKYIHISMLFIKICIVNIPILSNYTNYYLSFNTITNMCIFGYNCFRLSIH